MKITDIKQFKYNNNEVIALYKGGNLIYSKKPEEKPKNLLAGSFTEPGDYTYKLNKRTNIPIILNDDLAFSDIIEPNALNNCYYMFATLTKLKEITSFPDTSNVTDMDSMFSSCSSLTSLDLSNFNTENVTNMSNMFGTCKSVTSLDLSNFNTKNVTNMYKVFDNCYNINNIILGQNFDMGKVTDVYSMFGGCNKLKTLVGKISGLKVSVKIQYSLLTNESAMVFINGLSDLEETQTLTFSAQTFNTLSEEQIALATSKGWSVVSA